MSGSEVQELTVDGRRYRITMSAEWVTVARIPDGAYSIPQVIGRVNREAADVLRQASSRRAVAPALMILDEEDGDVG